MPSLISQMRNGQVPQQQPTQKALDASIAQVRGMMSSLRMAQNPQQELINMVRSNPQMAQIARMANNTPNGLEGLARQMAQANGIDINQLLQQLGGM